MLTLDACVCSLGTKEVEDSGERARRAVAEDGEDADDQLDSQRRSSIPLAERKKTSWRRRW